MSTIDINREYVIKLMEIFSKNKNINSLNKEANICKDWYLKASRSTKINDIVKPTSKL